MKYIFLLLITTTIIFAKNNLLLGLNYGQSQFQIEEDNNIGYNTSNITTLGIKLGYQFEDQAIVLEYNKPSLVKDEKLDLYILNYRLLGIKRSTPLALFIDISGANTFYENSVTNKNSSGSYYGAGLGAMVKLHKNLLFEAGYKTLSSEGLSGDENFNIKTITLGYSSIIFRF